MSTEPPPPPTTTTTNDTPAPSSTLSNSKSKTYNITVLISGNGSNLQALIDACNQSPKPTSADSQTSKPSLPNAQITHVISNKATAYGLTRASNAQIPTTYHNLVAGGYKKRYTDSTSAAREAYDSDLARLISTTNASGTHTDLVVCAGWMHILSPVFIDALAEAGIPVINLHPALPGQFDGVNAIGRAWAAYQADEVSVTGVMVHYVIGEVDRGEPLVVRQIEIGGCKSEEELEERVHRVEWEVIVEGTALALDRIGQGRNEVS